MSAVQALPDRLNMGIWWNDGERIWLPKEFCSTRNDAKRFALAECMSEWVDVRVRTVWVRELPDRFWDGEFDYIRAERGEEGAFECWEIDT